ncbi:MAG TPA: aminotransferase class V-fold PLP-dependent enzyme, partial [Pirellulaceae bacterium]
MAAADSKLPDYQRSMQPPRIYLDNAATTWPKPESVYRAIDTFQREIGVAAGRGSYSSSMRAFECVDRARQNVRTLFHASPDHHVVFGHNGTDVINLALQGFVRDPCHIITSVAEHNSVLRPLRGLMANRGAQVTYVPCGSDGVIAPDDVRAEIRPDTRLLAITHASNVTGAIQPLDELSRLARELGICLLIDAAQTAGKIPIDLRATPIDLLATSGHKGLLGPLGTAVLVLAPSLEGRLVAIRQGGTGTSGDGDEHPTQSPEAFEAGSGNAPGIAGLSAGIDYVLEHADEIRRHEIALTGKLLDGLHDLPAIQVPGPRLATQRTGTVAFVVEGWNSHELAHLLEVAGGIQVRAGLICA